MNAAAPGPAGSTGEAASGTAAQAPLGPATTAPAGTSAAGPIPPAGTGSAQVGETAGSGSDGADAAQGKKKASAIALTPYLWRQLGDQRPKVILGIAAVFVSTALDQVSPRVIQILIDGLRAGRPRAFVLQCLGVMLAAALVGAVLLWAQRLWIIRASRAVEYEIRDRLFRRIQRLPPTFFDRHPTGELMAYATSDLEKVRDVLGPAVLHLFRTGLMVLYTMIALLLLDWRLAAWAFLPLLVTPFVANRAMMAMHAAYARIQEHITRINTLSHDTIAGISVIKGFGREQAFQDRFGEGSEALRNASVRSAWVNGGLWPLVSLLGGAGLVLLFWRGALLVDRGETTIGTLSAAVIYLFRLQFPLVGLGWVTSLFQRGSASLARLAALEKELDQEEAGLPRAEPVRSDIAPGPRRTPSIDVRRLSFRYAPDKPLVLQDISFRLEPGQGLGIAGGPGSGKSTLLHLLCGLRRPPEGMIYLGGRDLALLPAEEVFTWFALAPQDGFLFSETIRANILMGAPDDASAAQAAPSAEPRQDPRLSGPEARLEFLVRTSCFDQDLPQVPGGLEAMLGERGINLSGGQRQRLGLARALAKDAPLLLLDDTLSAVDAETEAKILSRLSPLLEGRSRVITSHRFSAFQGCQEILLLDGGRVRERGSHEELVARGGAYARSWRLQILEREIEETR